MERIYIGGIQPPVLTVKIVQERLIKTLPQISFLSFDQSKSYKNAWGEDTQTFFFATIQYKDKHNDTDVSPLDIVAKQYNNVKWKGCTLRVEKAKLHFLKRLELERQQAKEEEAAKLAQEEKLSIEEKQNQNESLPTPKVKRHLRIRKQFGEEAYLVDTKPINTTNQKDLHLSLKKQREKRKKHLDAWIQSRKKRRNVNKEQEVVKREETNLSLQSKVFLNRAIHIQFNEENMERTVHSSIIYSTDEDANIAKKDEPQTVVSEDDDSSVPSSSSSEDESDLDKEKQGYNWSDDEEDSIDSDDDQNEEASEKPIAEEEIIKPAEVNVQIEENVNDESDENKESKYVWSDSDSDSDDSTSPNKGDQEFDYNKTKHDDLNEFASEFKDNAFSSLRYGEITFADENDPDFVDVPFSLEEDVESNLHFVQRMFPELEGIKPNAFDKSGDKAKPEAQQGWDAFGLTMQRYDPSAVTATNYEIEEEKKEVDAQNSDDSITSAESSEPDADDKEESDSNVDEDVTDKATEENGGNETESSTPPNSAENIYEQKKLENIFHQARNEESSFQMSSLFNKNKSVENKSGESGGFTFGFLSQEGTNTSDEKKDNTPSTGFAFGFTLDSTVDDNPSDQNDAKAHNEVVTVPTPAAEADVPQLKKRQGLSFTEEELDAYTTNFFNMNEGLDFVINVMKDTSTGEALKEKWEEERRSLTNDWKRKQKQAVALKKRRYRFR